MVVIRIRLNIGLLAETKRSYDGQRHFSHCELGWHRREMALKREIHQSCMNNVVLMMSEGNFRTAQFLSKIEDLFASLPRAEEAGRLGL